MESNDRKSRELLFFIEEFTWSRYKKAVKEVNLKHAKTYLNKFTIDENDQFEITDIQVLYTEKGVWKDKLPEYDKKRINQSTRKAVAKNLYIFFFGWYGYRYEPYLRLNKKKVDWGHKIDIRFTLAKKGSPIY